MRRCFWLLAALAAFALPPSVASPLDGVVASEGRVFLLHSSSYGELFPGSGNVPAGHPVLAVDELHPNGSSERYLVPGTEGAEEDSSPALSYEESSDSLALVWESLSVTGETGIHLASLSQGDWNSTIDVTDRTGSRKWSPRVVISQDRDASARTSRTIFHVTWAQGIVGYETTFYSPILLLDGEFGDRNPIFRLVDLDPPPGFSPEPGHQLLRCPAIERGGDQGTVVLGAGSATTGRLLTFDLRIHPLAVGRIADAALDSISNAGGGTELEALVDGVRAHIIVAGAGFEWPELLHRISVTAESAIRDLWGQTDLEALGQAVRAHIIVTADGWLFPQRPQGILRILEIAGRDGGATSILTLTALPGRPLPELDQAEAQPVMLLSGDGRDLLIAWETASRWSYLESQGSDWSSVRSPHPQLGSEPEAVFSLLERRARQR